MLFQWEILQRLGLEQMESQHTVLYALRNVRRLSLMLNVWCLPTVGRLPLPASPTPCVSEHEFSQTSNGWSGSLTAPLGKRRDHFGPKLTRHIGDPKQPRHYCTSCYVRLNICGSPIKIRVQISIRPSVCRHVKIRETMKAFS